MHILDHILVVTVRTYAMGGDMKASVNTLQETSESIEDCFNNHCTIYILFYVSVIYNNKKQKDK